jgi:Fic/DOC family
MSESGKRILDGLKETIAQPPELVRFQSESNHIEGINIVRSSEVEALQAFLATESLWIGDLVAYVKVIQPDARLRATPDIPGVRVGNYVAPPSGEKLMMDLNMLLDRVNAGMISAYHAHVEYETLHIFEDGDGRSGRALWLWQMIKQRNFNFELTFLHAFYYQSLADSNYSS